MIKRIETQSGSCMGADGSIFGIRAHLFDDVPENIIDDFYTSMSVICSGWRCIYSPRVIAYERSATRSGEEYRRKIRIACRAFNCHRLLWPRLRRLSAWNLYKYVSHKLLRWLMAFWIVGATVAAVFWILALNLPWGWLTLFVLLIAALAGAVAQLPGAPWTYGRQAVIAITATGIGVLKSLQGERFQTWSAAATTRQATLRSPSES
jgi:cellulose synthase/poly-beta-1,6-N-acetylglucosamine synthase-like glycosyltransferase